MTDEEIGAAEEAEVGEGSAFEDSTDFWIVCEPGSYAAEYAASHNIPAIALK